MESGFIKAFLSIVAVVAVLGAVLFVLKKYLKRKTSAPGSVDLKVVSKVALSPKSQLCVVKAGIRTLLIGITDNNVSLIADISDELYDEEQIANLSASELTAIPKAPSKIKNPHQVNLKQTVETSTSFSAFLRSAFGRGVN